MLALFTHTALRVGFPYGYALQLWFFPPSPLSALGISLLCAPTRRLLSSSGITRLHRYYEAIRLPMADSAPPCLGLVITLFPPGKRPWGLPGCRVFGVMHAMVTDPGALLGTGRGALRAPVLSFRVDFRYYDSVVLSQPDQFRGSIPSTFRLTAYMLAVLRLKSRITPVPPRTGYPAAAQPYRGGIPTR